MKLGKSCRIYFTFAILFAVSASAQRPGNRNRLYDPSTETTIKGAVEQVTQPSRGRMSGTHLFVKTDAKTTEVALGPSAFVSGQGILVRERRFRGGDWLKSHGIG